MDGLGIVQAGGRIQLRFTASGELALLAALGGSGKDAAGVAPEIGTAAATER